MLPVCAAESKAAAWLEQVGRSFAVGWLLLRLHLRLLLALRFVVALGPQVGLIVSVRLCAWLVLRLLLLLLLLLLHLL